MLKQKEWIEVIVEKTGCSKKEAKVMYDCVFDYMREQISPEELIKISGFGVLKLKKTAQKEQVNVNTGQLEVVPEHHAVTFRPYFEIDPKPEPIDMEDEDMIDEILAQRAAERAAREAAEKAAAEEKARKEAEEKAAAEEAARKEAEEKAAAEEAAKQEEAKEEAKEEAEEAPAGEFVWMYEGKAVSEDSVKHLMSEKGDLSQEEAQAAVDAVKEQLRKNGKTTCELKEEKDSFSFTIAK